MCSSCYCFSAFFWFLDLAHLPRLHHRSYRPSPQLLLDPFAADQAFFYASTPHWSSFSFIFIPFYEINNSFSSRATDMWHADVTQAQILSISAGLCSFQMEPRLPYFSFPYSSDTFHQFSLMKKKHVFDSEWLRSSLLIFEAHCWFNNCPPLSVWYSVAVLENDLIFLRFLLDKF